MQIALPSDNLRALCHPFSTVVLTACNYANPASAPTMVEIYHVCLHFTTFGKTYFCLFTLFY